jgi:hypothetical protein
MTPIDEAKHSSGVAAGEQDGEPRHDDDHERGDVQEEQHHVVGERQQPLHQRQPPVEITFGIGLEIVKVDRLVVVGGGYRSFIKAR